MSDTFIWIAAFAFVAAFFNALGILAIFRHKKWAEGIKTHLMCFAAGVLISAPLMLALPVAIEKNFYAGSAALVGFLFMFLSNKIIKQHTKKETLTFGMTAAEGIGIHSLVDGIIYTVTFSVSILVGILSGIGLVIHEFAEGVITYLVLREGGLKERSAALYAFFVASLTTPIGAFVAYPFISGMSSSDLGLMLGFSAGVLIYVSSSHLLPQARKEDKKHSFIAFLAGVALALFIVLSKFIG
ncbi:MAG: zinc/iron permease [Candidatus Aenigmatarchaeota archaeon]|nr:MAG: zinc/iron permease [Candidatus Aenigmarchaeota archaeon]